MTFSSDGLRLPPGTARLPWEVLASGLRVPARRGDPVITPPTFVTAGAYAASVRRFGEDKVNAFGAMCAMFGEPELAPLSSAYGHGISTVS